MGSGFKLINMVLREMDKAQRSHIRENTRLERERIRKEKQLKRERIREEKEDTRLQKQIENELLRADKEKLINDLDKEKRAFEFRIRQRRNVRLDFLNRM